MYRRTFTPDTHGTPPHYGNQRGYFSPNDGGFQRHSSPYDGGPARRHGSPHDGGPRRHTSPYPSPQYFRPSPHGRGGYDFRERGSPRFHTPRHGYQSPYGASPSPSPHNRSYPGNHTPYDNHSGDRKFPSPHGRGRRGHHYQNSSFNNDQSFGISRYFSPRMLEDPWAEFEVVDKEPNQSPLKDAPAQNSSEEST